MQELFVDELKDLYSTEKQIVRALPKLAKATPSEELRGALLQHLEETKEQVSRFEQITFRPSLGNGCATRGFSDVPL
ncbi:MAG: DUF892 family protein [Acidobacteriaceae bacterium]